MHMSLSKRNTVQEDNLLCTRCSAKSNTERDREGAWGDETAPGVPPVYLLNCSSLCFPHALVGGRVSWGCRMIGAHACFGGSLFAILGQ